MSQQQFRDQLLKYLPQESITIVYRWLSPYQVKLKITKPRRSKLGDFRVLKGPNSYAISVNGNLNQYAFLITLVHEIAHLIDFDRRKTLRMAHGETWKAIYAKLLTELRHEGLFPPELGPAINNHINRPKAASCSDPILTEALRSYDTDTTLLLREIPTGAKFAFSGRIFVKGELKRTRFRCQELDSNRWYMVHGDAPISLED